MVVPNTQIEVRQENGSLQRVNTSANLADVVKGLNALGATPQDLLAILQAMKSAGAARRTRDYLMEKPPPKRCALPLEAPRRTGKAGSARPVGTMDN